MDKWKQLWANLIGEREKDPKQRMQKNEDGVIARIQKLVLGKHLLAKMKKKIKDD